MTAADHSPARPTPHRRTARPHEGRAADGQHVAQVAAEAGLQPTVSIARRAAELLTDVGTCAELIDAITRSAQRTRFAAAMALMVTSGKVAPERVGAACLRDLVVRAALERAAAEVAP